MLLDYYLSQLVRGRLRDLQPVVLDILRLGLYQILCMDKIPDSAAVNEAVEQGKKYANSRAAGLINGVLRSAIRRRGALEEPRDLATRYSHPQPLVELLAGEMEPEDLERVLAADNQAPETVLQANPLAGDPGELPAAHRKRRGQLCAAPLAGALLPDRRSGQSGAAGGVPAGPVLCPGRSLPAGGPVRRGAAGHAGSGQLRGPRGQELCRRHGYGGTGASHFL